MRKLLLCVLSICLLFSITACGSDKKDTAEATTAAAEVSTEATTGAEKDAKKDTTEAKADNKKDDKTEAKTETEKDTAKETTKDNSDNSASADTTEAPTTAKSTGATITLYYQNGNTETLTEDTDGTYIAASNGARYYLGEDGVYRARGYEDLYTSKPEASADSSAANTMTAYYENGTTESLTEDSDGTWLAPNGARYYLGDDGVLRATGYLDLYTTNPAQ